MTLTYMVPLAFLALQFTSAAAQPGLADYQGAWLIQGPSCAEVFAKAGDKMAFKKPVDPFAPAFIISGNRLRTPTATCQIKSSQPKGDRQALSLRCANSVASNDVAVLMAGGPDGTLRRFFNERDTTGTPYQRCAP